MIIDEHRHIGNCEARGNPTMADILCELDKLGVDCAVIAPGSHPVDEPVSRQDEYASTMDCYHVAGEYLDTGIKTREVMALQHQTIYHDEVFKAVRESEGKLLGCCWINPHLGGDAYDQARAAIQEYGLRYIKLHPSGHAFAADDAAVLGPVMELAQELDMPLWLHSSAGPGTEVERLVNLARSFPKNQIIMGHVLSQGLLHEEQNTPKVIDAANAATNLWVDLSHSGRESLGRVLKEAPQDRLMLATDNPYGRSLEEMITNCRDASNGDDELCRRVMGENAAGLLKIG